MTDRIDRAIRRLDEIKRKEAMLAEIRRELAAARRKVTWLS